MLKRTVLLAILVAAVSAGWASGLFWFGLSQFVTGFTKLVENCPTSTASCVTGSLQLIFGGIAAGVGGYNIQFQGWRRSEGIYHLYEAGHPEVEGLIKLSSKTGRFVDNLKHVHVGKENEASIVYHHKDGSTRKGLYHFNNATGHHHIHASFHTIEESLTLSRREQVDVNDGFGALFNDMDAGTWSNVDHANNDIGYWNSHTVQQMQDADADSFCMGFQDPDNGNENVGALRVQPANENDYNGVTFDPCGSDNFRRRGLKGAAASVASQSEQAARELRTSIKRRLGWGKDNLVSRAQGSILEARSCTSLDCDTDEDCTLFGCGNWECGSGFKCNLKYPECGGHPSTC